VSAFDLIAESTVTDYETDDRSLILVFATRHNFQRVPEKFSSGENQSKIETDDSHPSGTGA
jgi:hypothetical protein